MTDTTAEYLKHAATETARPLTEAMRSRKPNLANVAAKEPGFQTTIPADHHMESLADDGTHAAALGRNALGQLWDVHEKIISAALKIENRAELAKQVGPVVDKAISKMQSDLNALERQIAHAQSTIEKEVGSGMSPLAQEIRGHVKSLPENERFQFAREAVSRYDVATIKALIAVPSYLSGLSPDVFALVKDMGEELIDSKSFKERATARAAHTRASRALEYFQQTMNANLARWKDGDHARIADLMASLAPPKKDAE